MSYKWGNFVQTANVTFIDCMANRYREKLLEYRLVGLGELVPPPLPTARVDYDRGIWPVYVAPAVTCRRLLEWNDGE